MLKLTGRTYTKSMSVFVIAVPAQKPRSEYSKQIALLYAAMLVIFAVAQLYSFDTFMQYFPSLGLPFPDAVTYAMAAVIVVAEIFALPFLLRMTVSPAFRWGSMVLGWCVPLFWLGVSFWVLFQAPTVTSIAFLGGVAQLEPGWWAITFVIAIAIMAGWASWGLWPRVNKHSKNS